MMDQVHFFSYDNNISIVVNNISNGIPILQGIIEINYKGYNENTKLTFIIYGIDLN